MAGCGVQANQGKGGEDGRDCESVMKLADVQTEVRQVDLGIINDRPVTVTFEALRRLVKHYRAAAVTYGDLDRRVQDELARLHAEQARADLIGTWTLMAKAILLKRSAIRYFARVFSDPTSLRSSEWEERAQTLSRRTDTLNKRLEASMSETLATRGFERRPDGQFILDCR
jgi:hypothetical protein